MALASTRRAAAVALVVAGLGVVQAQGPASVEPPLPAAAEVFRRHVQAIGGIAAYQGIKSIRARGRIEMAGQQIVGDIETLSARPNRLVTRVTVPAIGQIEVGFDGKTAWSTSPISGPEVLEGRRLSEAADDAWFDATLHALERFREAATTARTEFDGRPAFKVHIVLKSGNEQTEYFDVERGWQIGSEAPRATPQGVVSTVSTFRDYRRFGALMEPTTAIQSALGFEQVITLTSLEHDVVPDEAFAPPPSVLALIGR